MTQWVDPAGRGRARGVTGLFRAWVAVVVAPRQFFDRAIAPGDQAPGLVFLMAVVGVAESSRYVLVGASTPIVDGSPLAATVLLLVVTVVLIAPVGLHLLAALQTILLWPVTEDRAGVSETVQVLSYATAPCVFVGLPWPSVTVAVTAYGAGLLVIGLATVHDVTPFKAAVAGVVPATVLYGLAFGGFDAVNALL